MPSFGQLMIDDYLRASQHNTQVLGQGNQTLANINQSNQQLGENTTNQLNQSLQAKGQAEEHKREFDQNEQQQNQQFEQQRQDRYQQLLIHHETQMNRQKDEDNRRIAASARLWGRAQAEQNKPWDTTKVNPAWPDDIKEQALMGYEEGKGKVAMIGNRTDAQHDKWQKEEGTRQENRRDMASYKSGLQVQADLQKWKQKGGELRLQLAPLYIEMLGTRGMRKTDAREAIANTLRKAGVVEGQIQQKLSEMDSQVGSSGQQQAPSAPAQQQSNDPLDEWGQVKVK